MVIHRRSASALFLAVTLAVSHASAERAGSPCELRWESGSEPGEWTQAMHDVRAFVAQLTAETTDCRSVAVSRDEQGATVVFTTADGRSARRRIAEPHELRGLVEALLVNGRDPAPLPPPPESSAAAVPAPQEESAPAASAAASESSDVAPRPLHPSGAPSLLLGAGAGVKGSFPRDTVAGVGQVFAGASFGRWELAAFGRWELEHDAPADANVRRLRYSAIGGGGMFGRREPIGPFVLIAGTRASVLAGEAERVGHHDALRDGKVSASFLDPRLGVYVGCILLESSRVRLRVQVDADAGLVEQRTAFAELPGFPRWNLGISLGAETGLFR